MANSLIENLTEVLGEQMLDCDTAFGEVTIQVAKENLIEVAEKLRDDDNLRFEQLVDLTVVDYIQYGLDEWATDDATGSGFSRGRQDLTTRKSKWKGERFAVVYHLLSISLNRRLRVKVFVKESRPTVPSVINIWNGVDWFEREAFDLFGILFEGHPDLRRLLTDYGFVGHPFRKDFPLIGNVEMRFDAKQNRCVYEPVSIQPRVLVPKVIRENEDTIYVADPQSLKESVKQAQAADGKDGANG